MKRLLWCLAMTVLWAPCCAAQSAHEKSVGAHTEQICDSSLIASIAAYLQLPTLVSPADSGEAVGSVLVAAACKADPAHRGQTLVAVAYDAGDDHEKNLIVASVDGSPHQVVAVYQSKIDEDAVTQLDTGSLWIDTAAYVLAPGVRAFGLDVTGAYTTNCGDGGTGAKRSLFVRSGKLVRPVLENLTMSSWQFIRRGQDRCNAQAAANTPSIIQRNTLTLGMEAQSSNGYHDLRVDVASRREGGRPQSKGSAHYTLHYDGKNYPVPTALQTL